MLDPSDYPSIEESVEQAAPDEATAIRRGEGDRRHGVMMTTRFAIENA
jgi:hypothetical protein